MRIPRPAQRRAILLQHRVEHAEARADHQLEEFGFRVDQEVNERQGPDGGRFNSSDRTGYARLLHGGSLLAGLRPRLVTTRVPRAVRSRRSQISTVSGTSPPSHPEDPAPPRAALRDPRSGARPCPATLARKPRGVRSRLLRTTSPDAMPEVCPFSTPAQRQGGRTTIILTSSHNLCCERAVIAHNGRSRGGAGS